MGGRERILVVEDDEDVASVLCTLLRAEGYSADCIPDGLTAVKRVSDERPDGVVLDVMLPGLDGFEVCRRLKFHRETNLIPILMLTALADEESFRSGMRVGANRYLTKPFNLNELLRELRAMLDHRRVVEKGNTRTKVVLRMESDGKQREQLNDMLSELFLHTPLSEEEVGRIRYAALEMIENAAEWGNRREKGRMVTISYEVTDDAVKFVIADEGPGFDRTNLPHAAKDDDPVGHMEIRERLGIRSGGFGILIASGMVDQIEYNDAGNQVTLVKHFGSPSKAAGVDA